MIDQGMAVPYSEPEKEVMSKTGDRCIVATQYQWFLNYGEDEWREFVRQHLSSNGFDCYNPQTQVELDRVVDWLKEWGCSRTQGLGTRLPWDDQFVIESLSDSTIYMAYYAVHHMLSSSIDGSVVGPLGVKPEDFTHDCWEFIYRKGQYPENCAIPHEKLCKLRNEFEYWYPMDLRCSGLDLIRNHLTMCLYNHAAIWADQNMMPKSFFCNGYVELNGEKMAKSTGNFITMKECIQKFGADATRLTVADAGDTLAKANFDERFADQRIKDLITMESWMTKTIKKMMTEDSALDFKDAKEQMDTWDRIFDNQINYSIEMTTQFYDEMKYKQAAKCAFFEMNSAKEEYMSAKGGKINPYVIMRFMEAQMVMLNPIVPHFAQFCWNHHIYPMFSKCQNYGKECKADLTEQPWPVPSAEIDHVIFDQLKYVKEVRSKVNEEHKTATSGGKKKKSQVKMEEVSVDHCVIFVETEYPEWKTKCVEIMR